MALTQQEIDEIRKSAGYTPETTTPKQSIKERLGITVQAPAQEQPTPTLRDRLGERFNKAKTAISDLKGPNLTSSYGSSFDSGNGKGVGENFVEGSKTASDNAMNLMTAGSQVLGGVADIGGEVFNAIPGVQQLGEFVASGVKGASEAYDENVINPLAEKIRDKVGVENIDKVREAADPYADKPKQFVENTVDIGTGVGTILGAKSLVDKTLPSLKATAENGLSDRTGNVANTIGETISKARTDRALKNRTAELTKVVQNNATLRKVVDNSNKKGLNTIDDLAKTDLLADSIDNTGTINSQNAIDKLNNFIRPQEDVISKNLKIEGKNVSLDNVETILKDAVNKSGVKGGAKVRAFKNVEDDIAGYKLDANPDGTIPVATIHDAKVDKYANINYLNPESAKIDKVIAKTLKEIVENNTQSVDVKSINAELSKYYSMQKLLETLNGKKVEGGRLGKLFAQSVGAIVGNSVGGPLGAIAGAELGGFVKGQKMSRKFGKGGDDLKMSQQMEDAIQSSKNDGNLNTTQSTTINPTKNVIDDTIPQTTKGASEKFISDEAVAKAREVLNKAGKPTEYRTLGITTEELRAAATIGARYIEDGVRTAVELGERLAKEGYKLTKAQIEKIFIQSQTLQKGARLDMNKIDEAETLLSSFSNGKFSSPQMSKSAKQFITENGLDYKPNMKDGEVKELLGSMVEMRKDLRQTVSNTISKELQPLAEEAKKYKSAEEFSSYGTNINGSDVYKYDYNLGEWKSLVKDGTKVMPEIPDTIQIYHRTNGQIPLGGFEIQKFNKKTMDRNFGDYIYASGDATENIEYGPNIIGFYLPKNKVGKWAEEVDNSNSEWVIKDIDALQKHNQKILTDLWNKANGKN